MLRDDINNAIKDAMKAKEERKPPSPLRSRRPAPPA